MALTHTRADGESWLRTFRALSETWLTRRRALWILGFAAVAAGLALSWGWLAAVGVAPILVAVLPCAAMCALGLCMNKMGGRSCAAEAKPSELDAPGDAEPPPAEQPAVAEPVAAITVAVHRPLEETSAVRSEAGGRP